MLCYLSPSFFFFNDTAPTEIYTLSLHDALPIFALAPHSAMAHTVEEVDRDPDRHPQPERSEEHTSELQSHHDLVCRLLLEKKKIKLENSNPSLLYLLHL